MCLAFPASVVKLHGDGNATVSLGGVRKTVSLALLDDVAEGDFVIVHTGYALGKLDPDEAERTLELLREAGIAAGETP